MPLFFKLHFAAVRYSHQLSHLMEPFDEELKDLQVYGYWIADQPIARLLHIKVR